MKLLKDVYDLHNKKLREKFSKVCCCCCLLCLLLFSVGNLFVCFCFCFFFLPSCSPGWSLAHFEAEDDFELLPFLGECWGYRRATSDVWHATGITGFMHTRQALYQWATTSWLLIHVTQMSFKNGLSRGNQLKENMVAFPWVIKYAKCIRNQVRWAGLTVKFLEWSRGSD